MYKPMKFHRHRFGWKPSVFILLDTKKKWVWLEQSESLVAVYSWWWQKMRQFFCPWQIARPWKWSLHHFSLSHSMGSILPERTSSAVKQQQKTLSKTSFCLFFLFEAALVIRWLRCDKISNFNELPFNKITEKVECKTSFYEKSKPCECNKC